MKITVATQDAQASFYPTPPHLAKRLLEDIDWYKVKAVLEPSAGTGNLLEAIAYELAEYRNEPNLDIDLIEIDPSLRGILSAAFLESGSSHWFDKYRELDRLDSLTAEQTQERDRCYAMYSFCNNVKARFVHNDFISYDTMKPYDLIVMNPPFSKGEAHLMRAIAMQMRYGGQIRCILNAETLRNPCNAPRQHLMQKLTEYGAEITFVENAFEDAERSASVDVAIIKLNIPAPFKESDIYSRLKKAEEQRTAAIHEATELTVSDKVQSILSLYRVEVQAGIAIIQEYIALSPYILERVGSDNGYNYPILGIAINSDHVYRYQKPDIGEYVRAVRKKYWQALFSKPEFVSQLTSSLQEELQSRVAELADYEFSEYNIRVILSEMNARMVEGIHAEIMGLFDKMTLLHHWRNDVNEENVHYYNGWATNKAWKVGKKVILPCHGAFSDYSWDKNKLNIRSCYAQLADIERVFNYLDGCMTAEVSLEGALERAKQEGRTRNIQTKYFDVTFYKKGTMHLSFTNPELMDRFNIYCSRNKGWLPPSYGAKRYQEMSAEELAVIDSFHGDSTPGSGCTEYTEVMRRAAYYLAPPNHNQAKLAA